VFIRGGNYIASDLMLRQPPARVWTEVALPSHTVDYGPFIKSQLASKVDPNPGPGGASGLRKPQHAPVLGRGRLSGNSLKYEPASELLHISVKWLFSN